MSVSIFKALTSDDIASIRAAIEALVGEERRARTEGKLVDLSKPFSPTVWQNRPVSARDRNFMNALSALSHDARDELQALFFFGRGDHATFQDSLRHVKSSGGGVRQAEYLYTKLSCVPDHLESGLNKISKATKL